MAQTIQILRTTTNTPPPTLLPGALSAELGPQTKLWIGAAAGNRLLLSTDPTDITLSGGAIIASAAPNAMPGSLWWDSNIGQLYIRYFDGNSTAWVSASTGTSVAIPIAVASGGTGAITAPAALTNLGAVAKAGDTMTGPLTIASPAGYSQLALTATAGNANQILGERAGSLRWEMQLGGTAAETGSNAGTDFLITRFSDAGTALGTPLTINRATGNTTFNSNVGIGAAPSAPLMLEVSAVGRALSDPVRISVDAGRYARLGYLVNTVRQWSTGVSPSGSFAVGDNTLSVDRLIIDLSGNCTNVTGTWGVISDGALKQDIVPYQRGLAAILALDPVQFRYRPGTLLTGGEPSQLRYGLIAEDVQPVIPEIVGEFKTEEVTLGMLNAGDLVFVLINAVKELNAKVEALAPAAPAPRR